MVTSAMRKSLCPRNRASSLASLLPKLREVIYPKETKRTMRETIDLFLSTYRSENYKDIVIHDGTIFGLTENEGWVKVCDT